MIKMSRLLICFVGIDGSGKTTIARMTEQILRRQGMQAKYVWAAYNFIFMKYIVKIFKKIFIKENIYKNYNDYIISIQKFTSLPLISHVYFVLISIEYMVEILFKVRLPLLLGKNVIVDRYVFDTAANLAVNLGFGTEEYMQLVNKLLKFCPMPDIIYYIDVPEEVALKRKNDIPDINYLKLRKRCYDELAKVYKIIILNNTGDIEGMKNKLTSSISLFLNNNAYFSHG